MRTLALAMCSVVVAAAVYLVTLAVVLLALIFGIFALMAASGGRLMPRPGWGAELLLLLLPAAVIGAILARVRPFFRPLLSGMVGTAVAVGGVCVLIGGASHLIERPPQWELVLYPATAGLLAALGAIAGTRVGRRDCSSAAPRGQP